MLATTNTKEQIQTARDGFPTKGAKETMIAIHSINGDKKGTMGTL